MPVSARSLVRRPSAWLPIAFSAAAMLLIGGVLVTQGTSAAPAHDEGTPAHVFQLLMLLDVVAIVYFGLRWLPAAPRAALGLIAIQVLAVAVPIVTIVLVER